jgi:diguanylate cyclase
MPDIGTVGLVEESAAPRLLQEQAETLQRLRLGGSFYVMLWLLSGAASGLWERARWPYLSIAAAFVVLAVLRFRIHGLPSGASEASVHARLNAIWGLLLANAGLWGAAIAWLLLVAPNESARTVAAISSFAFTTAFAHNFPMRLRSAFVAIGLLSLSTLAAFVLTGARFELVTVSVLYLIYISLALKRSHAEYLQRLDVEDALRQQRDLFEQQSRRDVLTGLANRRRFSAVLNAWLTKGSSEGSPLTLLILDLDHFKTINDRYGHAAGDACLRAFAEQLQQAFPASTELVARLGGEEFGALLSGVSQEEAMRRAENFRRQFAERPLARGDRQFHCSVSIGLAEFDPRVHANDDALYHAADAALYSAKAAGRNTVRAAE